MPNNIDIVYFDAGSGHRTTANALKYQLELDKKWNVSLVNLRDILDSIDPVKKWLGFEIENFYNGYINTGWTIGSGPMLRILQSAIRLFGRRIEDAVFNYWSNRYERDLIVSVIPNFNKQLYNGINAIYWGKKVPYVTIMCDLADIPPHFWMEQQNQYIVCGSDKAWHQALWMYPDNKIYITSGMIIHPKFYNERNATSFVTTGIVSYGGMGSSNILTIAKMINKSELKNKLNIIFICGNDKKVFNKLSNEKLDYYNEISGFTDQLPMLMDRSDFFIGKPGPGSISEALVKKLPVLVEDSYSTMVQERFNIEWIISKGFGTGTKIGDVNQFNIFINKLPEYKRNIETYNNRAIFEVPKILENILEKEKQNEN